MLNGRVGAVERCDRSMAVRNCSRDAALGRIYAILTSCAAATAAPLVNAHADQAQFPDLSRYIPVDVAEYSVDASTPGIPATRVFFLTPDGITCSFLSGQAQCLGNNFPRIPPATPASDGSGRLNWIGTSSRLQQTTPSGPEPSGVKTLPPLHSITVNGTICGVDNSGTTACKDSQGHGFVLSPHGSAWLPHV